MENIKLFLFSIIPLLVIIVPLLLKKYDSKKICNAIFFGIFSCFLSAGLSIVLQKIVFGKMSGLDLLDITNVSATYFFITLVSAGIPEELGKFLSIKFTKYKNRSEIIFNSLLIAATFASYENFLYYLGYGMNVGIIRILQPGHILFSIFMIIFLIKNMEKNNKLYLLLAIVVPALIHAFFNTLNGIDLVNKLFCIIGIVIYISVFIYIIVSKCDSDDSNTCIKFFPLKIIILIFVCFLSIFIVNTDMNSNIKLNETKYVEEENIEITVFGYQKEKVEDELFEMYNDDYYKIKVMINNKNSEIYYVNAFGIKLCDSLNKCTTTSLIPLNDSIFSVEPNSKQDGYFYVKDEGKKYEYLVYTTHGINSNQNYTFNIK